MEQPALPQASFAYSCLHHPVFGMLFRSETYRTAEVVHSAGSPIREFGIVMAGGCLKASRYTASGDELCNCYFERDDVFPELLYFSGKKEYTYTLVAVRKTTVLWLGASVFEQMLREEHDLMYRFMLYMSERGLKNQMLLCCLRYQTIRKRVAYWLIHLDDLAQGGCVVLPPSQTIWANTLRVSRSSLNQEIKHMEELGYFRTNGHLLQVLDRKGLESLL